MVKDCKHLDACPLFQRFKNEQGKAVWIAFFCRGDSQADCERLKMKERGETVPVTLLPTGTHCEPLN